MGGLLILAGTAYNVFVIQGGNFGDFAIQLGINIAAAGIAGWVGNLFGVPIPDPAQWAITGAIAGAISGAATSAVYGGDIGRAAYQGAAMGAATGIVFAVAQRLFNPKTASPAVDTRDLRLKEADATQVDYANKDGQMVMYADNDPVNFSNSCGCDPPKPIPGSEGDWTIQEEALLVDVKKSVLVSRDGPYKSATITGPRFVQLWPNYEADLYMNSIVCGDGGTSGYVLRTRPITLAIECHCTSYGRTIEWTNTLPSIEKNYSWGVAERRVLYPKRPIGIRELWPPQGTSHGSFGR